jgi:hypothetical protein
VLQRLRHMLPQRVSDGSERLLALAPCSLGILLESRRLVVPGLCPKIGTTDGISGQRGTCEATATHPGISEAGRSAGLRPARRPDLELRGTQ